MKKRTIILLIIILVFCLSCTIWSTTYIFLHHNIGSIECFTVNDDGIIYLGCTQHIFIIENGEIQNTIDTPTSHGYYMSIEDNMLLVDTIITYNYYSLDRTFIKEVDAPEDLVRSGSHRCFDSYGNKYSLKNRFGAYYITKTDALGNESIYYRIPFKSAVANTLYPSTLFALVFVLWILIGNLMLKIFKDTDQVKQLKMVYNMIFKKDNQPIHRR